MASNVDFAIGLEKLGNSSNTHKYEYDNSILIDPGVVYRQIGSFASNETKYCSASSDWKAVFKPVAA
jgi:hypothetical protein